MADHDPVGLLGRQRLFALDRAQLAVDPHHRRGAGNQQQVAALQVPERLEIVVDRGGVDVFHLHSVLAQPRIVVTFELLPVVPTPRPCLLPTAARATQPPAGSKR